ncbi:hypothetical protein BDV95DRAFT_74923 [Massariosphaeria phaeospora]|uniref:Uncharacterized protein n=1 Tax=Massariosphaeria phaeospora TaxID=100035 RepID=A0A7C8MCW2_9PLEO|nr:hypothetical protein BDV95DRAFT_74923 [Massariosphaeria phaeospora]
MRKSGVGGRLRRYMHFGSTSGWFCFILFFEIPSSGLRWGVLCVVSGCFVLVIRRVCLLCCEIRVSRRACRVGAIYLLCVLLWTLFYSRPSTSTYFS